MNNLEKSLMSCLDYAKVSDLGPLWDGSAKWEMAIVLVQKIDGTSNYAICACVDGTPSIQKDFGSPAVVGRYVEIHPYKYPNKTKKK